MSTKVTDWKVSSVSSKVADYDPKISLINFTCAYQGGKPETLVNMPFPKGTTEEELVSWCASDASLVNPAWSLHKGASKSRTQKF